MARHVEFRRVSDATQPVIIEASPRASWRGKQGIVLHRSDRDIMSLRRTSEVKSPFGSSMATFHSNAARICELSACVQRAWSEDPHGSEHHSACEEFHRNYDSLAFPGGLRVGLERLTERDPQIVELVIQFLEYDPRFFRSGYIKEKFLRRLKRCDFTDDQRRRIGSMIVRSVDSGGRREFKGFSRLAVAARSSMLVEAVTVRRRSSDPEVVRRANAVMHVWESNHWIAPVVGDSNGSAP